MITIVGFGTEKGDLTKKGLKAIKDADKIVVNSLKTPAGKAFKSKGALSMDEFYEKHQDFDTLYAAIADNIINISKDCQNLVYIANGDGFTDSTAFQLLKTCKTKGIECNIIAGVSSYIKQPFSSLNIYNAYDVAADVCVIDTNLSLSVYGIDNKFLASDVKLQLLDCYDAETPVTYSFKNTETKIPLFELDRQKKYDTASSIFIDATDAADSNLNKKRYSFADLMRIMQRLTAPDGCEWDKAQTHNSIAINLIEEAYEAVDAIQTDDIDAMIEEVGDVLLQSVFHSDIAKRSGEFTFNDVVDGLCKKLYSRHTHIFGADKASDAKAALNFWEDAKKREKNHTSVADQINAIPENFPSILKAEKTIKRFSKNGITLGDAEEIKKELTSAIKKQNFGKALFYLVAIAQSNGAESETELLKYIKEYKEKVLSDNNLQ